MVIDELLIKRKLCLTMREIDINYSGYYEETITAIDTVLKNLIK